MGLAPSWGEEIGVGCSEKETCVRPPLEREKSSKLALSLTWRGGFGLAPL